MTDWLAFKTGYLRFVTLNYWQIDIYDSRWLTNFCWWLIFKWERTATYLTI